MTDARLSASFPTHPKTKKLTRRLGAAGPWALVCLFLWARMNRPDGDLRGMTDEDIELACDWAGDDGALVAALISVGFVDGDDGERRIHDWAEHQPWSAGAEDRKQSSAWAALCKRYGREGAAERMPDYAERMRPAREPHANRTDPACPSDATALAQPQCPVSVSVSDSDSASVSTSDSTSRDDSLSGIVIDTSVPTTVDSIPSADDLETDLLGVKPAARVKPSNIPCPGQQIADLWDSILCPEAGAILQWNERRARVLQARWREQAAAEGWQTQADGIKWFSDLFTQCRKSKFLMGKVPPQNGRLQFKLKFDWFFGPENFTRIVEGDFHRGK